MNYLQKGVFFLLGLILLGGSLIFIFSKLDEGKLAVLNLAKEEIPSHKPTPITPVATIKAKPLGTKKIPSPTLTLSIATASPTIIPTPSPTIKPLTTLSAGLKLVYGETNNNKGLSLIWLANASNLKERFLLATIKHQAGYGIRGVVSPDGQYIAYLIIPEGTSQKLARTGGGELWLMDLNNPTPYKIATQVGYMGMWRGDSQAITYGRWILSTDLNNTKTPPTTEFYVVSLVDKKITHLTTDKTAHNFLPLGWSEKGDWFYYVRWGNLGEPWEMWQVNELGSIKELKLTAFNNQADGPVLSADGHYISYTFLKDGQQHLMLVDLADNSYEVIFSKAVGNAVIEQYVTHWSAEGVKILVSHPPENGHPQQLEQIDLVNKQNLALLTLGDGEDYFLPKSWSPNEAWVVVGKYPQMQSLVYVVSLNTNTMLQIPLEENGNWISIFGWVN